MALARKYNDGMQQSFKSNEINTASQGQLIVMMYDGALRFIKEAAGNMTPSKYDSVNTNIIKAQDIITELMLSLDMNQGKFAESMFSVYAYLKKRLLEANIEKSVQILDEVSKHLHELRNAWAEAAKSDEGKRSVSPMRAEGSSFSIEG